MAELSDRLHAALGDNYRILRELGGGGMSRVFLAEEARLGRRVVIKVLPPDMAAGVNAERFEREIQLAASLQHPHIVQLLTAGANADLAYYVMPFIDGESLRARLAREGALPMSEVLRILHDVVDALAYSHRHGVVHRDIKPDNVMLSGKHALVTDFGVAKAVSASSGDGHTNLTSLGIALGTPAYMSPEQAAADPRVDQRADIYAVGAMAYEMLCGRTPFVAPTPQGMLAAHIAERPEPPVRYRNTIPPAMNDLVLRCLEKNPADRIQTADEIAARLDSMATPTGGTTPISSTPVSTARQDAAAAVRRSSPARVLGLFALASAAVIVAAYGLTRMFDLPDWIWQGAAAAMAIGLPIIAYTGRVERKRAVAMTMGTLRFEPEPAHHGWFTWRRTIARRRLGARPRRRPGRGLPGLAEARHRAREHPDEHGRARGAGPHHPGGVRQPDQRCQPRRVGDRGAPDRPWPVERDAAGGAERPAGRAPADGPAGRRTARSGAGHRGGTARGDQGDHHGGDHLPRFGLLAGGARHQRHDRRDARAAPGDRGRRLAAHCRGGPALQGAARTGRRVARQHPRRGPARTGHHLVARGAATLHRGGAGPFGRPLRRTPSPCSGRRSAWTARSRWRGASWRWSCRRRGTSARAEANDAAKRAYQFRDRLPAVERGLTEAYYHNVVTGDNEKTEAAYRAVLAVNPDEPTSLNNLGLMLTAQGKRGRGRAAAAPSRGHDADAERVPQPGHGARRAGQDAPRPTRCSPSSGGGGRSRRGPTRCSASGTTCGATIARPTRSCGIPRSPLPTAPGDRIRAAVRAGGRRRWSSGRMAESERLATDLAAGDGLRRRPANALYIGRASRTGTGLLPRATGTGLARAADSLMPPAVLNALPEDERPYMGLAYVYAASGRSDRVRATAARMDAAAARRGAARRPTRCTGTPLTAQAEGRWRDAAIGLRPSPGDDQVPELQPVGRGPRLGAGRGGRFRAGALRTVGDAGRGQDRTAATSGGRSHRPTSDSASSTRRRAIARRRWSTTGTSSICGGTPIRCCSRR